MAKKIKVALDLEQKLPLNYLTPLQGELKKLTDERKEKLKASILKHGFSFPFFVWENPEDAKIYIIDGHQRFQVLTDLKSEKYIVPQLPVVFIQAKDLKDAKSKLLAAASQYGEFTPEGIHDFTIDLDMGDIGEFAEIPFLSLPEVLEEDEDEDNQETITVSEHERVLSVKDSEKIKNIYSSKIEAPIYKPTMKDPPKLEDLYSKTKTIELIEKIKKNHNIDMDTKAFLVESAHRFTTFRYDLIAEYYAHASKDVQSIMEDLALVVIDFNKAIDNGFVKIRSHLTAVKLN